MNFDVSSSISYCCNNHYDNIATILYESIKYNPPKKHILLRVLCNNNRAFEEIWEILIFSKGAAHTYK